MPRRWIQWTLIGSLALGHAVVVFALSHPLIPSNLIQLLAPLIALGICLRQARTFREPYYRRAWVMLAMAFAVWAWAQSDYLWILIRHLRGQPFPGITDFLWLGFSFPVLLLASSSRSNEKRDLPLILDLFQATISILILFAVMYFRPDGLTDSIAYDIQGLGVILVLALRFTNSDLPGERVFFRDLTWFAVAYALLSAAGVLAQDYGSPAGGITDLAWSYPVLIFCCIAIGLPDRMVLADSKNTRASYFHPHINGISSVGLVLVSFVGSTVLILHQLRWGILCFMLSGATFAIRAIAREAQFRRTHGKLVFSALHDELTGLPNRRLLTEELQNLSADRQTPRALLLIDLDRFKMINDSLGHLMGDNLLIEVGQRIRSFLHAEDIVARFGGDEFVILLGGPHTEQSAGSVANRIVSGLRKPMLLGGRWITTTASVGVVTFTGGEDISSVLRNGDLAMYGAKSLGKNRYHLFEPTLLATTLRESELESALRQAIARGDIHLVYQPIYEIASGAVTCFEALARWTDPKLGTISPAEFIPIAESAGLIVELGRQVLHVACAQISKWNRDGSGGLSVSVNISTIQILEQDFISMLKEILCLSQCAPSMLWLEITESILMEDRARAAEIFQELRRMGIKVCLDDFGTGFSSLSYLSTFPFDIVKIDRSFIQDIGDDLKRREMVMAILHLATILEKVVVAEGIETQTEYELIAGSGCKFAQGFFLSRPLAPEMIVLSQMLDSGCFVATS